ncbi:MAG TPA: hypothetical protein VE818_12095 [Nitrososphaeraceae archaeon]|nr:hypothetical protein [Nitrososphaeraceae archaeon]
MNHRTESEGEKEEKRKLKRVDTDISTQFKDELQVTRLVFIY